MPKASLTQRIATHIFFVSLFLLIPALAFVRPPGEPFLAPTRIFIQDTTANFVLLCFFYLNYYVLLPRFFFPHKYFLYAVVVVVFLATALMLPYLAGKIVAQTVNLSVLPSGAHDQNDGFGSNPANAVLPTFIFLEFRRHLSLFFTAVFFSFLLRTRERLAELKEEKLEAELTSLKAQINPHFLFNTLNSIYALSIKKDDRASDAIIHLSGLMRYVIKEANDYKIPLEKEMQYITNYIELQRARLGHTVRIDFTCSGEPQAKKLRR